MFESCDNAWEYFKQNKKYSVDNLVIKNLPNSQEIRTNCSDLYISTTTIILYLNSKIDLLYIFPNIELLKFHEQKIY